MSQHGRSWAVVLSTVFFALYTLAILILVLSGITGAELSGTPAFAGGPGVAAVTFGPILGGWIIGLVTIVLLWQRQSREYCTSMEQYTRMKRQTPAA